MARNVVSLICAAAVTLAASPGTARADVTEDVVASMSNDDPMMRKAFKRARSLSITAAGLFWPAIWLR